jgi:hypothetical protein
MIGHFGESLGKKKMRRGCDCHFLSAAGSENPIGLNHRQPEMALRSFVGSFREQDVGRRPWRRASSIAQHRHPR